MTTPNHLFVILTFGASLASAATVAYVPVCCPGNSTISIIDTAHNRVTGSFTAGQLSYGVALVGTKTAWVTNDNDISIVALAKGTLRKTIKLKQQPWLIKASPDGQRVYVVTSSELLAFDASTGTLAGSVKLPNDGLIAPGLAISPDSTRVYASLDSATIVVYDAPSGTVAFTWGTTRSLTWVASGTLTLSPDGAILYTAGEVITAIHTADGSVAGTVNPPGPKRFFSFVGSAVTPNGATLYASFAVQIGNGAGLAIIDTSTLTVTASAGLGGELLQPVLSKDGTTLYVPDAIDSVLYVASTATLKATGTIPLMGSLATATLDATGSHLYVPNSSIGALVAVDTASLSTIGSVTVSSPPTNATATADGTRIFVAGNGSNSVTGLDAATNKVTTYTIGSFRPSVTGDNPVAVLVTPNGKKLYIGSSETDGDLAEIDVKTGQVNGVPCAGGDPCQAFTLAALPDSRRVYVNGFRAFGEGAVSAFYGIHTATEKMTRHPTIKPGEALAASPTGKFLYVSLGRRIGIFDTTQNKITGSLPVGAYAIAFSPDGATAYAANNSTIRVIDTASGQVTGTYSLGTGGAAAISVSPDGSQLWVPLAKSTSVVVISTQTSGMQTLSFSGQPSGVAFGVTAAAQKSR